ncbi:UrcA family protein [Erythrobacter sp. F6033]|uniref:UrcA family protein n=1 Tax=Erythrobacter sp. F6033 TaxID=2926401 RepID=UPI001FF2B844|nr:UrcA family protein [Erythrobacter sp. F6033]MCK0128426.1 UrcA family protein [Erythrobacter sp. F6033]
MLKLTALIAAPTLALIAAPAVAAGPSTTDFDAPVAHDDLDLTTEKGVAVLDERVKTIIRKNCANGGRDSVSLRLERQCRSTAFAQAETQIRIAVAYANLNKVRLASNNTPVAPEA